MTFRHWLCLFPFLVVSLPALAGEDQTIDDLARRNAALEERVRKLESGRLEGAIEDYLATSAAASGADSILPGGLALRVSGEVRVRGEILDSLYSPADPAGDRSFDVVHMRTRLRFDIDVLENLGVVIELQDVRTFGEEETTIGILKGVDLKRGTIVFKKVGDRPLTIELGRFVMNYGDQRLIGGLEWFDQGRTYDGIRMHYAPEKWWLDVFAVRVRETTPAIADDDQWFGGIYAGCEWAEAYALLFSDDKAASGETSTDDTRFVTLGVRVFHTTGPWDYVGEFAFQTGEVKGDDLSAFGFVVAGGYTFVDSEWKPRIGLEVVYATGDNDPTDGDQGALQTLFPTNHIHYGYADLLGWSNLLDLRLRVSLKPSETITVGIEYHHFRRIEELGAWINAGGMIVRPGAAGSDLHLGDEIDLTLVWKPSRPLSFLIGYSLFVPGTYVQDTGADPLAHFFYIQASVIF